MTQVFFIVNGENRIIFLSGTLANVSEAVLRVFQQFGFPITMCSIVNVLLKLV